jgi:hypothetical protein
MKHCAALTAAQQVMVGVTATTERASAGAAAIVTTEGCWPKAVQPAQPQPV